MFARLLAPILAQIGIYDWHVSTFIVRKTAHFLEYLVLGMLADEAVRPDWSLLGQGAALACSIMVAVPTIDESLQLLIEGRSGRLTDVMLDMAGVAAGLAIMCLLRRRAAAER